MSSIPNDVRAISVPSTVEQIEMSDGMRFARYRTLDELPGLVFGVLTLAYIFQSLTGLIW